jgi:hypothetical protein
MRQYCCPLRDEWNYEPEYPKWAIHHTIEYILREEYDLNDPLTLTYIEEERLTVQQILDYANDKEEWESRYGERDPDF